MKAQIKSILDKSMDKMIRRFEKNASFYPFIDTKFDIVSNRDFDDSDEPFRRRECIYSWIQGRGMESIAKHVIRFRNENMPEKAQKLLSMLLCVTQSMENLRRINAGRLPFAMKTDGTSFFKQEKSDANFSDLFYAKGLFAAGKVLNHQDWTDEGKKLFIQVVNAIRENKFRTDQQSFDPKNQVAFTEGKFPQGPRMISLGGIADMLQSCPEESVWEDVAEEFIRFIFEHHVNTGKYPELEKYDFIESVDRKGNAWRDGDMIFSDPGHALEFTGLASKCLLILQKKARKKELVEDARILLPQIFCHVFDYGFSYRAGGICKGYDLAARKAVNGDMPWWSLPETVRAGMELAGLYPENKLCQEILFRSGAAFQAFTQGFLQPNGFACQTRSSEGKIIHVIPAVSDADPGYHTNLSLMDVFA